MQAEFVNLLAEELSHEGLLDPVSAQTGFRVSEEIMLILAKLAELPWVQACFCAVLTPDLRMDSTASPTHDMSHPCRHPAHCLLPE